MERAVTAPDRVDEVVGAALNALRRLPGVRRVGFALSEGGGRRLRFTSSDRDSSGAVDWCHVDAYDDVPLATVLRSGHPVVSPLGDLRQRYAGFVEHQRLDNTAAVAAYPLLGSSPLGAIILYFAAPQIFDARQRAELTTLAEDLAAELRAAHAVTRRQVPSLAEEPVPPDSLVTVLVVDDDPGGVGGLRRRVRESLVEWGLGDDVVDDAILCLSELVTNALIHTRSGCEVRLLLDQGSLVVTVRDQGSAGSTVNSDLSVRDPLRVHGRGLQLVDALSSRWGSMLDTGGATVWFALETPAEAAHPL